TRGAVAARRSYVAALAARSRFSVTTINAGRAIQPVTARRSGRSGLAAHADAVLAVAAGRPDKPLLSARADVAIAGLAWFATRSRLPALPRRSGQARASRADCSGRSEQTADATPSHQ